MALTYSARGDGVTLDQVIGRMVETLGSGSDSDRPLSAVRARPDKRYSLVDCISMQTMRKAALTEVLTNDRHFEQEGFRALFRDL